MHAATDVATHAPDKENLEAVHPGVGGSELHIDLALAVPAGCKQTQEEQAVTFENKCESEAAHHEAPDILVAGAVKPCRFAAMPGLDLQTPASHVFPRCRKPATGTWSESGAHERRPGPPARRNFSFQTNHRAQDR